MKEFSAFPSFVDAHAEDWKGKRVLMCEWRRAPADASPAD